MAPGTKSGFTFLEMVIALSIVGLLLTVAVPNVQRFRPGYERKLFVTTLSSLVTRAWQNALVTRTLHRVWFNLEKRTVVVEQEEAPDRAEATFKAISDEYVPASYTWPESLQIKDFFIDGADVMHVPGVRIQEVWFYVYPDGSCQEVIMNIFDTYDTSESEAGTRLSLVLSPFSARFTQYDTFQKP